MNINFVESYENASDNDLISSIKNGEYEFLQIIIKRYLPLINLYAGKYAGCGCDTEELVQDGTIALYSAVKDFDKNQASFSTFASLCIKRAMITNIKKVNSKKKIPDELVYPIDDLYVVDSNSPEKIFFDKENLKSLTDTIKLELSSLEYKVLLSFLSGKSYAGIADELKISVKSVDNSLKRIRKKLKDK